MHEFPAYNHHTARGTLRESEWFLRFTSSVTDRQLLSLLQPRSAEGCAHVLGYHAEGPFLHPLRKGAHSETLLMVASDDPPIETLERVYGKAGLDQDGVKLITLAPDVEGVMGCIPELTQRGVTVSIGHR